MTNYNQVSKGSGDKNTVMTLQKELNKHGAGLEVDGKFGPLTDQALRNYQTQNGLQVDGIAGEKTWASLMGGSNAGAQQTTQPTQQAAPVAAEPEKSYRYEYENDPLYQAADQKVQDLEGARPTYQGTYDEQVDQLYQEVMGQKNFEYDLNGDALWQQYKDQYTTQGKLAMMDTMGQAAALTGGYGSSYAQGVGQQAYQGYLQQLNDRVPELYQLALQKYNSDQALLKDKFTTAKGMQNDEYSKYMDETNLWYEDLGLAIDEKRDVRDYGQNAWYTGEQLEREDENTEYTRKENNYNKLANLIASTGYIPSQEERAAAGMSDTQVNALAAAYERETAGSYSGGDDGAKGVIDIPSEIKTQIGKYGTDAQKGSYIDSLERNGVISGTEAEYLRSVYLTPAGALIGTETENTKRFDGVVMTEDQWKNRTGSTNGFKDYVEKTLNSWLNENKLTDEEAAWIIEKYKL